MDLKSGYPFWAIKNGLLAPFPPLDRDRRCDVVVLGAGIVGVCVALHLQKRGRQVVLLDRREPGYETSFGNAGLIQREGVYPYGFPHDFGALFRYALNNTTDAHYHLSALPKLAPFLWKYWMHSRPRKHAAIDRFVTPDEFKAYEAIARAKGFLMVSSSPLTRSSHHAGEDFEHLRAARAAKAK